MRPKKRDKREIVRRGELRDAERVPMAKLADTRIGRKRDELSGKDRARLGERRFIFVPQALARERGEVISDLVALDVPNEGAPPGRKLETFQDVDIEGELNGVMQLRLAVVLVVAAFLAPAGLDVARHIAAGLLAQQIGHAEQVLGANAAAIDKRLAPRHRFERETFAVGIVRLGEIEERKLQLGDGLALEQRASFPQQAHKGLISSRLARSPKASSATRCGHCTRS